MTLRRNLPYARVTSANTSRSAAHRPRRKPRDPRRTSNRGHPQPRRKRQSALVDGFSLHAGVHLHANDREGLEKLCGYGARPPFALERLSVLPDGRVCYRLKRPTADERTELRLAPTEFLRKLASLIPPPRHHWFVSTACSRPTRPGARRSCRLSNRPHRRPPAHLRRLCPLSRRLPPP